MTEYLEELDNELGQVFAEFLAFLYVTHYDAKDNQMLHNIMLESKRIHMRALCDFFSNSRKKGRQHEDDLIYRDFLSGDADLSVEMNDDFRKFINKSTAHITKKRGKIRVTDEEYRHITKELIKRINDFMWEIENGNLRDDYREKLLDKDVQEMKQAIYTQLLKVILVNAQGGVVIQL